MAGRIAARLSRTVFATPPPLFLAGLYAALIALGTLGLMLPVAQATAFGWADALFTSASSVTVTGLAVVDTAAQLTPFGQGVQLALIQVGGLGIMAVSVMVLSALGLPIGLTHSTFLRDDLNQTSIGALLQLVRQILRLVLACELAGAAALAFALVPVHGAAGLWHALFLAVAAFNNAGLTTLPGGLVPLVADPTVNLVVTGLVIVGGIGYGVLAEAARERRWRTLSLHAKLMLVGTAALLFGATLAFALLEWSNPATLGALDGPGARLIASWFQSVTPRSAGFNTVDIAALEDGTTTMLLALMLVGAGPTSTGGGIKVTTAIVLLLATIAFFRRQTELHAFGRSIGLEEVLKVSALTAISLILVFLGAFVLTLTHQGEFLDVVFEVTSAFSTTGLSRGETGQLDGLGRAVVILLMFVGRVGPLTLGFFLATQASPRVRYPPAQVYLG
jgi:trk system potassium uptake protein TrkH